MDTRVGVRRPGWVTIAASLLVVATLVNAEMTLFGHYSAPVVWVLLAFYGFLFGVAVGLFMLKKWAYWAFIIVALLSAINTIIDLVFVALGVAPANAVQMIQIIQLMIGTAWIIYFLTPAVRRAFEIGGPNNSPEATPSQRASASPGPPSGSPQL